MNSLTIQNFKILKTINKGAFAQVYEALDTNSGRTVALKIVIIFNLNNIVKNGLNVWDWGQNYEIFTQIQNLRYYYLPFLDWINLLTINYSNFFLGFPKLE